MICFDLFVNGEKLCTAGHEDIAVLTCMMVYVRPHEPVDSLYTSLGGLCLDASQGSIHSDWINRLPLKVGDEITVRIVDSETADRPVKERKETAEWLEEQKRKTFENLRAEFKGGD